MSPVKTSRGEGGPTNLVTESNILDVSDEAIFDLEITPSDEDGVSLS